MGYTYVYNLGSYEADPTKEISLEVGLFFDGTGNNHRNVEIRKKIQKIDEYADQSKPENRATFREKAIYYSTLLDDSYKNDFSNVARLWRGCEKDYKIYIEGIGTNDEGWDNLYPGMALGEGNTGIRAKVIKGCEHLAEKIKNEVNKLKKERKEIQNIYVTIDVFGFSRGAAAARNFLYEINGTKRQQDQKIVSRTEYESYGVGPSFSTRAREVYYDKDGHRVHPAYLDNGRMPQMGYLGYYLLENGLTKEELKKIILKIRFVGLYDTVSSYGRNHENDVEQLQLNDLGYVQKVVYFTAMDEHRANFSLTRIPKGENFIEKEFPGVHSDIGGGYKNDYKDATKKELNPEFIREESYLSYQEAEQAVKKLVSAYWYEGLGKDLRIYPHIEPQTSYNILHNDNHYYIEGMRKNAKEYSYIFLHFMEYLFGEVLEDKDNIIIKTSRTEYSIAKFSLLIQAKNYLKKYLFNQIKKWNFIADQDLKQEDTENQRILRELRKKYLHRSAKLNNIPDILANAPAEGRKRIEH